jgi:death-on-curing protein
LEADPVWLTFEDVSAIHLLQLALHGGTSGFKDEGLIESAVVAPKNLWIYESCDDVLALGIRLCAAISQNHGFIDGNKRTAAGALLQFVERNGYRIKVPDDVYILYDDVEYTRLAWWVLQLTNHEIDEVTMYELLINYVSEV